MQTEFDGNAAGTASQSGQPLRILYHHRIAASDGMRVHIQELVSAFRDLGHEVLVVGPGGNDDARVAGDEPGGLEKVSDLARRLLPAAAAEVLELGYNLVAYRRLAQAARAFRPDVLYERYNLYLMAGHALAQRTGLPLALEINSPLAQERARFGKLQLKGLAQRCEQTLWRAATFALPVSEVLAEQVREKRGRAEGVEVVHNGARLDVAITPAAESAVRARLGLAPDDLVLGFVGFVRDWHGVNWAMDVLPELGPKAHMVVVGDGPALANLKQRALAAGVEKQTHFVGAVPHHEVAGYVATFNVALQVAAVAYASPLKIFDYMQLGRAIVAPDQANIREILTDGSDALFFRSGDAESFKSTLVRLCKDGDLRARLGAAAKATLIRRRFTWTDNAKRIAALYATVR